MEKKDPKKEVQKQQEVTISNKKELDAFTNELAKKLTKMSGKETKKSGLRRLIPFNVSPLFILVSVIVLVFFVFNMIASSGATPTRSLSQVISGLRANEYSQVIIRNDGTVQAKDKTYAITKIEEEIDPEVGETGRDTSTEPLAFDSVKEVGFAEIKDLFKAENIVSKIRSSFGNSEERIEKVIFGTNYVLFETPQGFDKYIIKNTTKANVLTELADNNINLDKLGIEVIDLRIYAEELTLASFDARVKEGQFDLIYSVEGFSIAEINPELVKTYDIDWTPGIFTFTELLQNENFSLSSDIETFEVVPENIPEGITFDTILTLLTIGGFVFIGFVIFRSAQASGMGVMQFGQSKAKMFFGQKIETSFADVAGIDEAKEELNEIVDFLKSPNKYRKLGARIPKGVLMVGAPGTGKTLLARAIAGEAGVPFFHTSGSEFEEMLVGAGASRVRDLFAKAKKAAPSLIFIDEIDAIARKRGTRIQSGSTEQTLNQILVEMDGFEKTTNVIVIAATNRPDVLDNAILRPGRFDRQVRIEVPDKDGRLAILKIHTKNKPLDADVDLEKIAKRTVGFTGADLENIMNEAAIIAAKENKKSIAPDDIDEAVSKVLLGPAKRSRRRTQDELDLVAYHEAGHALVAKMTKGSTPVDKISIVSRGSSGGVTMFLPEKDENIISKTKLMADIRVSLGGRAAEEVALADVSTGASSDIQKATKVARQMIQRFGMSKDLGMVMYGQSMDSEYLGYAYGDSKDYSEDTAQKIDMEVREIIDTEYKEALAIIKKHKDKLDVIAKLLLDKEVLDKEEFEKIFEG